MYASSRVNLKDERGSTITYFTRDLPYISSILFLRTYTHLNNATVENQARTKACVVKRKYYNLLVKGIFLLHWHGLTTVVIV